MTEVATVQTTKTPPAQPVKVSCCFCGTKVPEARAQVPPLAAISVQLGKPSKEVPTEAEIRAAAMCGRCAYDYRGRSGDDGQLRTFSLLGSLKKAEDETRRRKAIAERRAYYPTLRRGQSRLQPAIRAS